MFIFSLLPTVDATYVPSLFLGREPQNQGSLVRRQRLDVPGLAQPPLLGRRRSPDGSPGSSTCVAAAGTARRGAHRATVPPAAIYCTASETALLMYMRIPAGPLRIEGDADRQMDHLRRRLVGRPSQR